VPNNDDQTLTSGQVLKALPINRSRLRRWERMAVIHPTMERRGRRFWRYFPQDQVDRLRRLLWLLEQGLCLVSAVRKLPEAEVLEAKRGTPFVLTGREPSWGDPE